MVNILQPIPNTCPSFLYSIAAEATELANPVIGTNEPAPAKFPSRLYKPKPVKSTELPIRIILNILAASCLSKSNDIK